MSLLQQAKITFILAIAPDSIALKRKLPYRKAKGVKGCRIQQVVEELKIIFDVFVKSVR